MTVILRFLWRGTFTLFGADDLLELALTNAARQDGSRRGAAIQIHPATVSRLLAREPDSSSRKAMHAKQC
jgi:hypothetical protein